MSDYLDTLNALLPEGMRFEWVPAEPAVVPLRDERVAAAHRRAWSGPNKLERQILRAYKVSAQQIGLAPRSAFSSAYRQRQRNRVKRRRR